MMEIKPLIVSVLSLENPFSCNSFSKSQHHNSAPMVFVIVNMNPNTGVSSNKAATNPKEA